MGQEDINKDLGHYIKEKHRKESFWKKFKGKPSTKEDVQEDIKHELEAEEKAEDISPKDKKELEEMEHKIVEVNEVEEKIDQEREGLLKKFFKKLNFAKKEHQEEESEDEEDSEQHEEPEEELSDEEMKQFLKSTHSWITQLSPEKQKEFKESKDFELYTKVLKKHNLIK